MTQAFYKLWEIIFAAILMLANANLFDQSLIPRRDDLMEIYACAKDLLEL